ncbi:MAG: hypothetical protein OXC30_05670 [Alphaproteobacteria bacterium]|nr:hypothetical protein [Alphaproteobacteria bacterium]
MAFLLYLICLCSYGSLERLDERTAPSSYMKKRGLSERGASQCERKNLRALLQTHEYRQSYEYRTVGCYSSELYDFACLQTWNASQSLLSTWQRQKILDFLQNYRHLDIKDYPTVFNLVQTVASALKPIVGSKDLRSGEYNDYPDLKAIYDAFPLLQTKYSNVLQLDPRFLSALDKYYLKEKYGNALCSLLSALEGFCMRDPSWTKAAFKTHATWLSSDGAYGCDQLPVFSSSPREWKQAQELLIPLIREQIRKSLAPCLNGACIVVHIDELDKLHHMMKEVSDNLEAILHAYHPSIPLSARKRFTVLPSLRIKNGKYGDFRFYDDSHLDLETFFDALSELEGKHDTLFNLENQKKMSIVRSYYIKKEYQQAFEKLVIALEYFCKKDRDSSDKEFCCFLQHLSAIRTPLTPQLWYQNAQEILVPYRALLIPSADYWSYDLDQLRVLAKPILATLEQAQSKTYYGSAKQMMERKRFVLGQFHHFDDGGSCDAGFHCDMETLFYLFSELEERCDSLSSLDIAKKGITHLCYVKQKYQYAYAYLFDALYVFCTRSDENYRADLNFIISSYQNFWRETAAATDPDIPVCEWWAITKRLMTPYRDDFLQTLSENFIAVSDLGQLRVFSEPILTVLQKFYSENYHGSAEEMIERKKFVLEELQYGATAIDMECFFCVFDELETICSGLLDLDSREVGCADLYCIKKKYSTAYHKLLSAFKTLCIHAGDIGRNNLTDREHVNQAFRNFWLLDMAEANMSLEWYRRRKILEESWDSIRDQMRESLLPCLNGACLLVPIHELDKLHHMMKEVSDSLKPIVHAYHESVPSSAREKPMLRRIEKGSNGAFDFYDDPHFDLEKFVEAWSQLESEYILLLKKEDHKEVSIVESYYGKREYQQACDKLVMALEYFFQKDTEHSDAEYCCFLQHRSAIHAPLTPQLWCKNAQELLESYRESLRLPEDYVAVYDLDKLRDLAEPILATLQRAQSETYHGADEAMVMKDGLYQSDDKFAEYKQTVLGQFDEGNVHCDMETFFNLFAALKEGCERLSSLDIAKKGITHLFYIKEKYINAYRNLFKALNTFCTGFREHYQEDLREVMFDMKCCWREIAEANSIYKHFDQRFFYKKELDEWWGITKRLMDPYRGDLLKTLSEDFFAISDLHKLRVFAEPILSALQKFHKTNYQGSSEAMIERRKIVLHESQCFCACFDMEGFFYIFSELATRSSGLLALDSKEVSVADLCFVKQKYRSAYRKLCSALKSLCTHIEDDSRDDRLSTINKVAQNIRDFWFYMQQTKMPLSLELRWEAAQQLLGDSNREELWSKLSEDYMAKDLETLRTFSKSILTILQRVHAETYHGSAEEMVERKKFVFQQAAGGEFRVDVETFFYLFSELEEKYDILLSLDMAARYTCAFYNLFSGLSNFCKCYEMRAVKDLRCFWCYEICIPMSEYKKMLEDTALIRMYKEKFDVSKFYQVSGEQLFAIRDLEQLRALAAPILDTLQIFHRESYYGSVDEMLERRECVIKDALANKGHISLESYFYTFSYFHEQSARCSSSSDCTWTTPYSDLLASFQFYFKGEKELARNGYDNAWINIQI